MLFLPIITICTIQLFYWIFCLLFFAFVDHTYKQNRIIVGIEGFLEAIKTEEESSRLELMGVKLKSIKAQH